MRWRVTIRSDAIELRGYCDLTYEELEHMSELAKPLGMVIASPADDSYDPFDEAS